ncbi:polysaccharide lyase family 7 protein [Paenibacillus hamazuiensis]|uniref:polysaccharide lyase family 7 protein n=1 Tax=Paenibacillus hamazuiensis TaxID=2936508 RepID=UPI00200DF907|nr:polysaccharide lyase family 7 protein [Paenibacillus hamazuiensis]
MMFNFTRKLGLSAFGIAMLLSSAFGTVGSAAGEVKLAGTASASTYDTRCTCDASQAVDGSLSTRWSGDGDGAWLKLDLGSNKTVAFVKMAFYNGSSRTFTFDVQTSTDNSVWTTRLSGAQSTQNNNLQTFDFTDVTARYVRFVGYGNTSNTWNSYTEVEAWGISGTDTTAPTAPGNLTAAAVSSSQINLSWTASTDNVGVTGYDVYRGGAFLKTVTGTSASDTGLAASTTYSYTVKAKDAAGNASAASNTATATTQAGSGSGTLDPSKPPSGNFDLTKWKITLPDASEVQPSALSSGYTHPDWFYTDPVTGGMVFVSPNIGDTTSNSSYTRSELREMLNPSAGTKSLGNNFVTSTSSSASQSQAGGVDGTMKATLRVDRVSTTGDSSKVGRVVVGQIHGPDTEVIRLYYHKRPSDSKGAIYFGTDDLSNNNTYVNIIGGPSSLNPSNGIELGQKWSYEIKLAGLQLTVTITPEGGSPTTVTYTIPSGYNDKYLYYKAGVYNQNNTDTSSDQSDHVKATFFSLTHTHP